ncbi:MAG: PDZ domain-containing protein [Bacteroidales bacterium]|nr:PDZ domain-containing protein [Bacteroidales bacterium]
MTRFFFKRIFSFTIILLSSLSARPSARLPIKTNEDGSAASAPHWLRSSSISPDGQTIVFAYKGNIFSVRSAGGRALQLTSNSAWDGHPLWSPSGKKIAFTSEREGSLDIYEMTANGDHLTRLTTHSGSEIPLAYLNEDEILFNFATMPTTINRQFPSATFSHLFKVRTQAGSRPQRVSDLTAGNITIGPNGSLIYDAIKGYEDPMRKHHTSSIARDLWQTSLHEQKFTQLTTTKSEDRCPVYVQSSNTLYWLSEASGTLNVWCQPLDSKAKAQQLTFFTEMPVRYLSAANDGTLCFSWDGELYTMQKTKKPQKVNIDIIADTNERQTIQRILTSGATQVCHSPKNKEIAFILGGDVYVTSLDYKTTFQVTDTPERERHVSFCEDGRSLVYDSERNGRWAIYRVSIKNKDEQLFTYATALTPEERLTPEEQTCFEPEYSPDGKMIAFLRNRHELCVLDASSKEIRTVMPAKYQYSYRDGDQTFSWSPNSKYLLSEYIGSGGWNLTDIALVPANGKGKILNLTNSGYSDGNPRWVLGGKAFIFQSDRAGMRSHGSWGAEHDLYITFLNDDAFERFHMNKEERERFDTVEKERKKKEEKGDNGSNHEAKEKRESAKKKRAHTGDKKKEKDGEIEAKEKKNHEEKEHKADSIKALNPELNLHDLDLRTVRLTFNSSSIGDAIVNQDGTKLYYVASNYPNGTALWERDLDKGSTTIKVGGVSFSSFDIADSGKVAYYTSGGQIKKIDLSAGKISNIDFECFHKNYPAAWRQQTFEHIWHQTHEKLFDPEMNGADWEMLHTRYARYLPHISNTRDFAEMCSELLGELNVSHTGCRYRPRNSSGNIFATADLGVFLDDSYNGDGLRIVEVLEGTPLTRQKGVGPGCIITHIDGQAVKAGKDYYPLLYGKANHYTRLTINNIKGETKDYTIRLATNYADELYRRWVRRNELLVDSLSKGRLAYVHIKAMDTESFHQLYLKLLSEKNRTRDAVIIDVRHNGGGWLHNDICELLSGIAAAKYTPRGQFIGNDPYNRWTKPSCMLICEDDYSNAHGTPWLYKELGIGPLIGAPVPGTMTAVWWETIDDIVFGIPEVGMQDRQGRYLENLQLQPDQLIISQPSDLLWGRDVQLEEAVNLMLKKK